MNRPRCVADHTHTNRQCVLSLLHQKGKALSILRSSLSFTDQLLTDSNCIVIKHPQKHSISHFKYVTVESGQIKMKMHYKCIRM
jgi:hypothetical protein